MLEYTRIQAACDEYTTMQGLGMVGRLPWPTPPPLQGRAQLQDRGLSARPQVDARSTHGKENKKET